MASKCKQLIIVWGCWIGDALAAIEITYKDNIIAEFDVLLVIFLGGGNITTYGSLATCDSL
jgi:hypothetical protein